MTSYDYRDRLAMDRQIQCPGCYGLGIIPGPDGDEPCDECDGTGERP